MTVYRFVCSSNRARCGFTQKENGSNLPLEECSNWVLIGNFEITDDTLETGLRHKEISEFIAKDGYWIGPCTTIKFGGWEVVKGEIPK